MTLGSLDRSEAALTSATLKIVVDTGVAGVLEFHQLDTLRDAGRQAARAALSGLGRNGH
jgi:predicted acylesterase/phospholipase RssA